MSRELKRILLADLPAHEALGWTPATDLGSGAVVVSCFSGGLGQEVLVSRELDEADSLGPLLYCNGAEVADVVGFDVLNPAPLDIGDQHMVEDVITALRLDGVAGFELRQALLQALVEAADRSGRRGAALRHSMRKLELKRIHIDTGGEG